MSRMQLTLHAVERFHERVAPALSAAQAYDLLERSLPHATPTRRRGGGRSERRDGRSERWTLWVDVPEAGRVECELLVAPSARQGERFRVVKTVLRAGTQEGDREADAEAPPTSLFHAAVRLADETQGVESVLFTALVESVELSSEARAAASAVLLDGFSAVAAGDGVYADFAARAANALRRLGVESGASTEELRHWRELRELGVHLAGDVGALLRGVSKAVMAAFDMHAVDGDLSDVFWRLSSALSASETASLKRAGDAFGRIATRLSARPVRASAGSVLLGFETLLAQASPENQRHLRGICDGLREVGVDSRGVTLVEAVRCWEAVRDEAVAAADEAVDGQEIRAWQATSKAWTAGLGTLRALERRSRRGKSSQVEYAR